jgi:acyl-CoA thioesterase
VASGADTATSFNAATAVAAAGPGRYEAVCDTAWSAPRGPNGGYLAAIVLRAIEAEAADAARAPRSLTCHFLRPPADGPVRIEVALEREGRSVSVLSARLLQDDRLCVVALAALSVGFPSPAEWSRPAPDAPPPQAVQPWPAFDGAPPIAHRVLARPVFGAPPLSAAPEALTGGWLLLADPPSGAGDAALLAFYADAWLPAPFTRLAAPVAAPTVDLTVHFRAPGATAALDAGAPVLARFRSETSAGGFFEEDGELWAPDGTLLAQSRQLALLVAPGDGDA